MVIMKRINFLILSILLTFTVYGQTGKEYNSDKENNENQSSLFNMKEKGFYNIMQAGVLLGTGRFPISDGPTNDSTKFNIGSSFTTTFGFIFNKHWAAAAGIGFEIFKYNVFPVFAELRYTLSDNKVSPFVVFKAGYSFAELKYTHYDNLNLDWPPYYLNAVKGRNYGGFLIHPEVGIKVMIGENSDLLLTAAYRYQATKFVARKDYDNGQFDEWDHKENLNRLYLGIGIILR
jgi:hypothetical protein